MAIPLAHSEVGHSTAHLVATIPDSFTIGVSPETLRRTSLGDLRVESPVNLERSLRFGGRMGGHYVQGHVDGAGTITAVVPDGESLRVTIAPPASLLPYIVEKATSPWTASA